MFILFQCDKLSIHNNRSKHMRVTERAGEQGI